MGPLTIVSARALALFPSPQDCLIDNKAWSDCHTDLLDLLSEYDAINVRGYTLFPRGRQKNPTNVAWISFKRHDLPTHVYVGDVLRPVRPYVPSRQYRNLALWLP